MTCPKSVMYSPPIVKLLMKAEQAKMKKLEQRAEKLARRLLEMGVNPDEID